MPAARERLRVGLQAEDHGQLLDVIDELRSQGVSSHVPLPQIIVCGDQSSGKSSVLEAVSGVRFPMKDNLCTRFATELMLRRARDTSATVSIVPGPTRNDKESQQLKSFHAPCVDIDKFPSLVDSAKSAMGIGSDERAFSDDILRVEVSGPEQPHLTLVDLPGVIHAENDQQSAKDVDLVMKLVRGYMASTRSIILAVVSAKNDYANQIVTKLAREYDPKRTRTLGIITKPDTLDTGSESEKKFLDLARNENVSFSLGWHVLKNRDYDSRKCSIEQRNQDEREFFSDGIWKSLPPDVLGVDCLKPRLSKILKAHIMYELPSLIQDVKTKISECNNKIRRLGGARDNPRKQSLYLIRVSRSFTQLVEKAVEGNYSDSGHFFGDAMNGSGLEVEKRLRAVNTRLLTDLAEEMDREGEFEKISEKALIPDNRSREDNEPRAIALSDYLENVRQLIERTRGCELPGTFNPLIIRDLFCRQSRPWDGIVDKFAGKILAAVRKFVELALDHTMERSSNEGIFRRIINPCLESWTCDLKDKISEILRPYRDGHPITYNHAFTERIQQGRLDNMVQQVRLALREFHDKNGSMQPVPSEQVVVSFRRRIEANMDIFAAKEALGCMRAYYEVALRDLIDGVSKLAVEQCLLRRLPELFTPEKASELDDDIVREVAAEPETCREERLATVEKLTVLDNGLRILSQLPYNNNNNNNNNNRNRLHGSNPSKGSSKRSRGKDGSPEYEPPRPPTPENSASPSPRKRGRRRQI